MKKQLDDRTVLCYIVLDESNVKVKHVGKTNMKQAMDAIRNPKFERE